MAFNFKHFYIQSAHLGTLKMAISVSPAPLEQSLSSDNRTSVFPVLKELPLWQQEELLVVSISIEFFQNVSVNSLNSVTKNICY